MTARIWLRNLLITLVSLMGLSSPGWAQSNVSRELNEAVTNRENLAQAIRERLQAIYMADIKAPDFGADQVWFNTSRPLSLSKDLAGRFVLLDFWTYCCINCIHVLPDLAWLEDRYKDDPFLVVGVHSAKFKNEERPDQVRRAVLRYEVEHPVVVDKGMQIWRTMGINAWPSFALIGPDRRVLGVLSGEGQRDVLDTLIQEAMALYATKGPATTPKRLPLRLEPRGKIDGPLYFPGKVLAQATKNGSRLYISDTGNHRIVVTDTTGRHIQTIGSGLAGLQDGSAETARFFAPQGLAIHRGQLYVADTENHALRRVDLKTFAVTTVGGDGRQGNQRSGVHPLGSFRFNSPWALSSYDGGLVVADAGSHQLWFADLNRDRAMVFAGDGSERKLDGVGPSSAFAQPSGFTVIGSTLYVADSESSSIRSVELKSRKVRTVAGATTEPRNLFFFGDQDGKGMGRRFQHPLGVATDGRQLYVADSYNHKIKRLDPRTGQVSSYAGSTEPGRVDGSRTEARFSEPGGLFMHDGLIYIADTNNHAIRTLDPKTGLVKTLQLRGVPAAKTNAVVLRDAVTGLFDDVDWVRAVSARVRDGRITLDVKLPMPAGHSLAEGAPSRFSLRSNSPKNSGKDGAIKAPRFQIPVVFKGPGTVQVAARYYHCHKKKGICHSRAVRWDIEVEIRPRGATRVELGL